MILDFPDRSEITPKLFVGNQRSVQDFNGTIICVLERKPDNEPARSWILPLLQARVSNPTVHLYGGESLTDWEATVESLDAIADAIHFALETGSCLVHCSAGVERSPLAVSWYLFRKHDMSFTKAYTLVHDKRPIAQYRPAWLNRAARALAFPEIAYV